MTQLTIYAKDNSIVKKIIQFIKKLPGIYMYEYDEFDDDGKRIEENSYAEALMKMKAESEDIAEKAEN